MATKAPTGIHFEAEAPVSARPEIVWDILTDYLYGHPRALPSAFSDFKVESGGKGAGTVMRFTFTGVGPTRHFYQIASEPEPGRVLVEADIDGPARSTFTLTPLDGGERTLLHIATDQEVEPGFAGALGKLLTPLFAPKMRAIYMDEIARIEALAQDWPTADRAIPGQ